MRKNDLKLGMSVQFTNGKIFLIRYGDMGKMAVSPTKNWEFVYMSNYHDTLENVGNSDWDIVRVFSEGDKIIWERPTWNNYKIVKVKLLNNGDVNNVRNQVYSFKCNIPVKIGDYVVCHTMNTTLPIGVVYVLDVKVGNPTKWILGKVDKEFVNKAISDYAKEKRKNEIANEILKLQNELKEIENNPLWGFPKSPIEEDDIPF